MMRTTARRRNAAVSNKRTVGLRSYVQEALRRVWQDGIVELSFDPDESYFWAVHPNLSRALRRIKDVRLVHEREAAGGPIWWEESDPEEDPPDEIEPSRSYYLFFVSPEGEAFAFETEAEGIAEPESMTEEFEEAGWGEGPPVRWITGTGRTGWVVAVSLLAPLAVIELGDQTTFEDGTTTEAEIESYGETADGERINPEEHFRKVRGSPAYQILTNLHTKIAALLEKYGITVLPAEEWRKPVPWLRGGDETLFGIEDRPVRILDAFFFEEV